jgi:hypothetical protein
MEGWEERGKEGGSPYWYNPRTNVIKYTRPTQPATARPPASSAPDARGERRGRPSSESFARTGGKWARGKYPEYDLWRAKINATASPSDIGPLLPEWTQVWLNREVVWVHNRMHTAVNTRPTDQNALPPGWTQHEDDEKGDHFFENNATGLCQWEWPSAASAAPAERRGSTGPERPTMRARWAHSPFSGESWSDPESFGVPAERSTGPSLTPGTDRDRAEAERRRNVQVEGLRVHGVGVSGTKRLIHLAPSLGGSLLPKGP